MIELRLVPDMVSDWFSQTVDIDAIFEDGISNLTCSDDASGVTNPPTSVIFSSMELF